MNPPVVYVQYANPGAYPPLQHSARILADAGFPVLVLGIGQMGEDGLPFPTHAGVEVKQLPWCPPGWRQKLHYLWFSCWALGWILQRRAAWVYASDALSAPAGLAASFLGARVVYHEHDAPDSSGATRFQRPMLNARRRLLRRATLVVVPNANRGKLLIKEAGQAIPLACVWNCPPARDVARATHRTSEPRFSIVYHGTIVPARLPRTVIQMLPALPDRVGLRMIGYETVGHVGYVMELLSLADDLGVRHRVEFLSTVPREQLLEWSDRSDLGLALMPTTSADVNEQAMAGASNKVFDYLARGIPALVTDLPEWRCLIADAGYGRVCRPEDTTSLVEAVTWFLDHPDEGRAMGERGRERVARDWNYERQFAPVLATIQQHSCRRADL